MTKPLVTIGIAAFNAADTIERAVHSALAQDWRPLEIVVVDDCSDDGTPALLSAFAANQPELRVFRNEMNLGVAAARNRILDEAKGEFVAFFDDDDESDPSRITTQVSQIIAYEQELSRGAPVICHAARRLLYPNGSVQIMPALGQVTGDVAPTGRPVAERILLGTPLNNAYGSCATCSQMARLSVYRTLGGFDPTFRRSEDTELAIRLAKAGGHFVGIQEPLVTQTMTMSAEKHLSQEYDFTLMLIDKHRDIADRTGHYGFSKRWIKAKQAWFEGRMLDFARMLLLNAVTHPILTLQRFWLALPNLGLNRAYRLFHSPASQEPNDGASS